MCPSTNRLPPWLKKRAFLSDVHGMKARLRARLLHTVCEEARCPNMGECFSRGTATFMIMGDACTRECGFCSVGSGAPRPIDPDEPKRVALQIKDLNLNHAVITSVTRDDLPDGGAGQFAEVIFEVRAACPETTIEVLTPDFEGRDIEKVCLARPDVFNHNIETVERLTPIVRNKASFKRSLAVLQSARGYLPDGLIKSGLMVGLGETREEVLEALGRLKDAGCDIVTIGQYLRPSKKCLPVKEYLEPQVFLEYGELGFNLGFRNVFSGPFVRSSYMADGLLKGVRYGKESSA